MKSLKTLTMFLAAALVSAVQKPAAKFAAIGTGMTVAAGSAMAQAATNPIVVLLASIDLSTVALSIAAIALIVVAIALTMKGPDVAKRVIRKV